MKPNSQEFFSDFDPLYRTYDKQAALRRQNELFELVPGLRDQWDEYNARFKALANWVGKVADPFDVTLARGSEQKGLKAAWEKHRLQRVGFADPNHPFRLQGSADLNSYKMFAEIFWNLLRPDGRLGVILPTGIYSDFGTKDLRETLLFKGRLEFLYAFQNEKKIFAAADHRYKQVALFATRGGSTRSFLTRFRMGVGDSPHAHELPDDILKRDDAAMCFTPQDVRLNSPKTPSLVELKSQGDLDIFRKIYTNSIRIGDNAPGWEITYATEFHMTNDSKHFPLLEKWEAKGYKPDVFGRWIGPEGDVALPLYQGAMIHHFNPAFQWFDSGGGRVNKWISNVTDGVVFRSKYLIPQVTVEEHSPKAVMMRVAFRDIARNTDERTFIGTTIPGFPCGNTLPTLAFQHKDIERLLYLSAVMATFTSDYSARLRLTGSHMNYFVLQELPVPGGNGQPRIIQQVARRSSQLTFIHRRFAPEWLRLKYLYPDLAAKEWKHWWAVTEADRLRLRVEIDALCADLYGLDPDDFDWIARDDPTDPKGFYRVDRKLPFRERLTGLAAAAFRALKEGKWSAGGTPVADAPGSPALSNDEFFALIGIPELTNPAAAKAKNLSEPLILKREGCHKWEPETFLPDDPRHGWTWDHCWQDALALLGSEQAVKDYVEGKQEKVEEAHAGPKDLFGNPLPPKQGKLF